MHAEPGAAEPLRVQVLPGEPPGDLADLARTAAGSFFHTPAWLQAVRVADPRLEPRVIVARDVRGSLQAACPLLAVRRLGTTRLYSGAFGTYGGIVARTPLAARAVRQCLESLARGRGVLLLRVHDFAASLRASGADLSDWSQHTETCQVLDLPGDPAVLFRDAFTAQNRNKIRKAEKQGVQVRRAHDAAALHLYAALYADTARRWRSRKSLPEEFFLALAAAPFGVDVWIAERDGEHLAALLNFTCGGQIMNWGNVSRRQAWNLSPNNLLHWRALQAACEDGGGPRLYNLGSSAGLPGVETFKSAFGARLHAYPRLEHSPGLVAWWRRRLGR